MNLKFYKLINYLSVKTSLLLFKQRLPLGYVLFNYLYKKIIVNNISFNDEISDFHKSGFVKLKLNLKNEINFYKDKFFFKDEEKDVTKRNKFYLNDTDQKNFLNQLEEKLKPTISTLERYFNCDVFISDIVPFRIYHVEGSDNLKKEFYANNFHQDGYLMIYNKIFINMMDVNEDDGPLQLVPLNNKKEFFKSFKYKNRDDYDPFGNQNLIYKNSGSIGDCCLFSSPQVIHKAGIPKNYRDLIQIILMTIPKKYSYQLNIDNYKNVFSGNEKNIMKLAKPYNMLNLIKLFIIFIKEKRNKSKKNIQALN